MPSMSVHVHVSDAVDMHCISLGSGCSPPEIGLGKRRVCADRRGLWGSLESRLRPGPKLGGRLGGERGSRGRGAGGVITHLALYHQMVVSKRIAKAEHEC